MNACSHHQVSTALSPAAKSVDSGHTALPASAFLSVTDHIIFMCKHMCMLVCMYVCLRPQRCCQPPLRPLHRIFAARSSREMVFAHGQKHAPVVRLLLRLRANTSANALVIPSGCEHSVPHGCRAKKHAMIVICRNGPFHPSLKLSPATVSSLAIIATCCRKSTPIQ